MPDTSLRKNLNCVVGMPSCGYAFSSSRKVFIAYGFNTSSLEKDILYPLLEAHNLVPIEAAGSLSPASNAFCTKICSQIITSRFCVVLLNDDVLKDVTKPNANVHMEYGLMLGFNKYILPFQMDGQSLAFNISGLDTIKYSQKTFKNKAEDAIRKAIADTEVDNTNAITSDDAINRYLLAQGYMAFIPTNSQDTSFPTLAAHFGFSLYTDLAGINLIFVKNFMNRPSGDIALNIATLSKTIFERITDAALSVKIAMGTINSVQAGIFRQVLAKTKILLLLEDEATKSELEKSFQGHEINLEVNLVVLKNSL